MKTGAWIGIISGVVVLAAAAIGAKLYFDNKSKKIFKDVNKVFEGVYVGKTQEMGMGKIYPDYIVRGKILGDGALVKLTAMKKKAEDGWITIEDFARTIPKSDISGLKIIS